MLDGLCSCCRIAFRTGVIASTNLVSRYVQEHTGRAFLKTSSILPKTFPRRFVSQSPSLQVRRVLIIRIIFIVIVLIVIVRETDFARNYRLEGGTAIGGLAAGKKHTRRPSESPGARAGIDAADFAK